MKRKRQAKPQPPPRVAGDSSPRATGLGRLLDPRLLVLLLLAAAALYGTRYFAVSRNSGQQQDAHTRARPDPSQNDAAPADTEGPSGSGAVAAANSGPSSADPRIPTAPGPSWNEIDDPTKDGWDTEVFASKAKKQLKILGKLLAHPGDIDGAAVEELITEDFACEPLRSDNLVTVLDDQHLKIDRASTAVAGGSPGERPPGGAQLPLQGADGLVGALRAAVAPFADATDVRFEVKVFRVAAAADEVSTRQYFSISGRTGTGTLEQHATWDIGWARGAGGKLPRMRWLRVKEFEQAESRQPSGTLFADCTGSVLDDDPSYTGQFLRGLNYWVQRIQDRSPLSLFGNPGLAVGDVNGDGLDDLYVCQEAGLPNRLFVQNPDGTALDQSSSWGVDWLQSSRSALLVDLDNDSDQDLVVAILGGVVVAENNGQGRFHIRDVFPTSDDTMSLSAVDYDLDGRLDIYVCVYNQDGRVDSSGGLFGTNAEFVYHDANNGARNNLFRNLISADGTWKFTDVTGEVGLDEKNLRWSYAAAWDDFDNDGDQDLYVANDYGRDNFYRNDLLHSSGAGARQAALPQFAEISGSAGVEDSGTGMSITWGDYDRDGWMDVLVSNMWSSAGNRITFQDRFRPETPQKIKRRYQRLARGNTLLRNRGDGTFDDRSAPAGIEMGRWAWGSQFVDLNNDGWEDLIVSNGFITTEDTGDL